MLTDPPYTDAFEGRWVDLAEACARVLKPGAALVAYTGNHNLPLTIEALTAHLSWLWHVVLVQPGQESSIMGPHIHNGHRDLLVLSAGAPTIPGAGCGTRSRASSPPRLAQDDRRQRLPEL